MQLQGGSGNHQPRGCIHRTSKNLSPACTAAMKDVVSFELKAPGLLLSSPSECVTQRERKMRKNTLLDSFGAERDEDRSGQMRNYEVRRSGFSRKMSSRALSHPFGVRGFGGSILGQFMYANAQHFIFTAPDFHTDAPTHHRIIHGFSILLFLSNASREILSRRNREE